MTDFDGPPKHRAGAVIGFTAGGGIATASGYPNSATKIGDPNYYGASGLMTGTGGSLLIMGAIADYLNFGFWFAQSSAENAEWRSNSIGAGFEVDAFPFVFLTPTLANLGLLAHFGIGSATLDAKQGTYPGASGVQSCLGVGAFYEWSLGKALGGHFAVGPSLEYDAVYSAAIERSGALLTGRAVFYGGT